MSWSVSFNDFSPEVQTAFSRFQNELQTIAQKIGEIESEADEHECVVSDLFNFHTGSRILLDLF